MGKPKQTPSTNLAVLVDYMINFMDDVQSPKGAYARRRARKSVAHIPMSDTTGDQENLVADGAGVIGLTAQSRASISKNRSKSIGPGELDSLRDDSGNGQKVIQ